MLNAASYCTVSSLTDNVTVSRPMTTLDWRCHREHHTARRLAASASDNLWQDSRSLVNAVRWLSLRTTASTTAELIGETTPHPQNSTFVSGQVSTAELEISSVRRSSAVSLEFPHSEIRCKVLLCVTSLQPTGSSTALQTTVTGNNYCFCFIIGPLIHIRVAV